MAGKTKAESDRFAIPAISQHFDVAQATARRRLAGVAHEMHSGRRMYLIRDAAPAILQVEGERLDANQEIAKVNRLRAEQLEMRNAVERGELFHIDVVAGPFKRQCAEVVAILDALPAILRRGNPELTHADVDTIRREIARARNAIADLDPVV